MKILIFGTEPKERDEIRIYLCAHGLEQVEFAEGILNMETIPSTRGYEIIWLITNSIVREQEARALSEYGVKYIVTRSTGIDHLSVKALRDNGICAANVPLYSTGAVSEHTILLLLALMRKLKYSMKNTDRGNFTLENVMGKELSMQTVGIIGCGKIAISTIRMLSGFRCNILVSTTHEKEEVNDLVTFTDQDTLLKESDIILLHCPLKKENYHLINAESLSKMKTSAILVNTARGGLVDSEAILAALKSGKLSGYGFDVYEKEDDYIRTKNPDYPDEIFWELCGRDDVIYTSHIAFYTDLAMESLNRLTMQNVVSYALNGYSENEITKE